MWPLVTIGIPTYNRASSFLGQAIKSAVEQTYQNIEILISDNCSTDDTESLIKEFTDERIRYIKHPQNIGANNNFNFCVNNAKGDYFLLLHSDDLIDNDFIETCMNAVEYDSNIGVIFTGNRVIDENNITLWETPNKAIGLSTSDFFLSWFSEQTALYFCSTLFNTKKLQELGGFKSKTNYFVDVVAEVILAFKFGRADVYDVKASFRRHSSNMGGNVSSISAWCEDCMYLLDIMCDLSIENKTLIREKGLRFFARKNYRLASTIKSPFERYRVYRMINETFCNCFTPFQYIYYRNFNPLWINFRKKVKAVFNY